MEYSKEIKIFHKIRARKQLGYENVTKIILRKMKNVINKKVFEEVTYKFKWRKDAEY